MLNAPSWFFSRGSASGLVTERSAETKVVSHETTKRRRVACRSLFFHVSLGDASVGPNGATPDSQLASRLVSAAVEPADSR